jgi:hypothetical protein
MSAPTTSPTIRKRSWLRLGVPALALGAVLIAVAGWMMVPADDALPVPSATGSPWFREVADSAGVQFTCQSGGEAGHLTVLEFFGAGVALFDYDGDGWLDIFLIGGGGFDRPRGDYPADHQAYTEALRKDPPRPRGEPCKLYRNLGNWKFRDVTREVGLDQLSFYTQGCAVADFNRDGWPDLLVTGFGKVGLWKNVPDGAHGRRFVDVTAEVGLIDPAWGTSAGWADLDGDGWPDLYICQYLDWSFARHPFCKGYIPGVPQDICGPQHFQPLRHFLYRNQAGRTLRDVSAEHGVGAARGLGVLLVDVNDDGQPDIYVANDNDPKWLFLNRSGKLQERARQAGVAADEAGRANGSMGVDAGDYDGSGRPSLWVTNFQGEVHNLYRNLGRELFQDQSYSAGIAAIGQQWVGFGTAFVDVDSDGWEDLVIANGHVAYHPTRASGQRQRPLLLRNVRRGERRFFEDASAEGGPFFQVPTLGRGLAVGDLDNDGRPDLVVSHLNSPVAILRNQVGGTAHWMGVRLVGRDHRDIVGSTVVVEQDGRRLMRFAKGGGSYGSASDPRILFGLGDSPSPCRVTVKWSWGQTQTWPDLAPDSYWELHEGQTEARRSRLAPGSERAVE